MTLYILLMLVLCGIFLCFMGHGVESFLEKKWRELWASVTGCTIFGVIIVVLVIHL
jgi:predicted PurR-regulated permease PerM